MLPTLHTDLGGVSGPQLGQVHCAYRKAAGHEWLKRLGLSLWGR